MKCRPEKVPSQPIQPAPPPPAPEEGRTPEVGPKELGSSPASTMQHKGQIRAGAGVDSSVGSSIHLSVGKGWVWCERTGRAACKNTQ